MDYMGKGSTYRSVNTRKFAENWDKINWSKQPVEPVLVSCQSCEYAEEAICYYPTHPPMEVSTDFVCEHWERKK